MSRPRAVVFGYHDVADRCLRALVSGGVDVALLVTHRDDPAEERWFACAADTAREHGIEVSYQSENDSPGLQQRIAAIAPDFIFSFYYRALLSDAMLGLARRGALNMHGSLLPDYRGRAPVNWAVLNGETRTGATLHYMAARADAGDIVDQLAVPILEDDDARIVMHKVTVAAETVLWRSLPGLIDGTAPRSRQDLSKGRYFGRRRPEDGRIDWRRSAREIHNLIRAVAPPFPGAFCELRGERLWIHRSRVVQNAATRGEPQLHAEGGRCLARCGDGHWLEVLAAADSRGPLDLSRWAAELANHPVALT
ncbi:MAG: formyltransferase [Steroidobacteraceae bacterium]